MHDTTAAPTLATPERLHPRPPSRAVGRFEPRHVLADLPAYVALVVVGFVFLLPFVWMFLTSFKPTEEVFRYASPLTWKTFIPPAPTLQNYRSIFTTWSFHRDLFNTLIAASGQMLGACLFSTLAAYVFARLRFPGRDVLFALTMLTAFVPFDVVVVPLYVVMRSLNLVSTYPALFLPFIFSPFGIFLMRQAFLEIPRELDEAATIEGASPIQIFWHVILPNGRPALVTLALIQFMWSWNSYLWPLVIMQDPNKQVVQVTIAKFRTVANFPLFGELFAAATAATIPILILFFLLQRYYIRGMLVSGMK
ncbi:MAG: carbohydrate ABC transporter permease [Chloroflexi bacterium]|nr:carbohydrate ABC transporter permease [Chloroflexota bacterium]